MRTGISLATIREEVMIEAGLSNQPGHSAFSTPRLNQLINRTERMMFTRDEWPTLHFEQTTVVPADAQYAPLPADISFTMIETVHVSFGSEWLPVKSGIGARERTIYNETQRATPIQRYEFRVDRPTEIEVWPIGAQEQRLMFAGSRTIGGMVEETDLCALDADVIVMRVAAKILGRDNQADAALLLQEAEALTNTLLKRQGSVKREPINMGRTKGRMLRPGIDFIPPGGD